MLYCVFPVGHVTQDVGINDEWAVYKRQATATKGSKHVNDNYDVSMIRFLITGSANYTELPFLLN